MANADIEVSIDKLLRKIASEQGFKDYKLQITPISSGGANYSSVLYTAKVEDNQNVLNLFVKVAILSPEASAQMGFTTEKSFYDGELHFYSDVSKIYSDIELKHKVPEEDKYILPKYYGANKEKTKEMLVLEDLGAKGFTTYDRFKSIDWPYAASAVKELAKFHALSMAFEKEYPEIYKKFIDKYNFNIFNEEMFKMMYLTGFDTCVKVVREENREKLKKFYDNITSSDILKMYQPVKKKVLIHTDFRPSNLMHRYREDGTIQVVTLDYQTFQEGCPVIDMLYFILVGSDEEFRRQHFDQLMDHYYTELSAAMTRLGVDNRRYSRDDFDQDLKEDGTNQVILIDYQTYQESCPVIDLMYFVFTGSDEEFRRQYFHQLMEHYYTELSAAMTRLGIDNNRYSRDDFEQDFKVKLKYGLVIAAQVLPAVTMDPKETPTVEADLTKFAQFKPSKQLVERLNGVVNDFVRWGIL